MGVLTDLIIASSDEADEVAKAEVHAGRWPTLEMKGFSSISFGMLLAILRDEEWTVELFNDELLAAGDMEEGPWVTHVPDSFVEAVAVVQDEQLPIAAGKWAGTEELSYWSPGDLGEVLSELRSFCAQAREAGTSILMWVCL